MLFRITMPALTSSSPTARGAGLGQLLLAHQNDICHEHGNQGAVSYVAIHNCARIAIQPNVGVSKALEKLAVSSEGRE